MKKEKKKYVSPELKFFDIALEEKVAACWWTGGFNFMYQGCKDDYYEGMNNVNS